MTDRIQRLLLIGVLGTLATSGALATPQFAREQDAACSACHTVVPMLGPQGLSFQATGYLGRAADRSEEAAPRRDAGTIPMAAWITARYEDKGPGAASDAFLPKVELISGGRIAGGWSYFVEWRIVSDALNSDGTLGDRGGRFEDLFAEWRPQAGRVAIKLGQYRSLNQTDVSLRLSPDEPELFKNGLRTGIHVDPRLQGLDRFSPASRSPSVGIAYQSIRGERAGDGLFHFLTVPFLGEFSIPLGPRASTSASFELGQPKGVYAETFFRRGLHTIGGHAFLGRQDAWLVTLLASWDWRALVLTAGAGLDGERGRSDRERGSVQAEFLVLRDERWRGAAGIRAEDVADDGSRASFVPYIAVSAPSTRYTLLLQLGYRSQDGGDSFVADLSALF